MKRSVVMSGDAFARSFDKKIPLAGFWDRVLLPAERGVKGRRKDDRFFFYLRKRGRFSLFAPTLAGKVREEGDSLLVEARLRRPLLFSFLLSLWIVFLLWAWILLVFTEFALSLVFLLSLPVPLFLMRVGKRDREELLRWLDLILAK